MGLRFSKNRKSSVIIVGLDNSGKSTIVNSLKPEKKKKREMVPTVGFMVETFSHNKIDFTMYDMSGQGKYRNLWEHNYKHAKGIIFVIDSADTARMVIAKNELDLLLNHKDIANSTIPILFFANKKDLPKARSVPEIHQALELNRIDSRAFAVQPSDALRSIGLNEGMEWLSRNLP